MNLESRSLQTINRPDLIQKFPKEVKKLFDIFGNKIRLVGGSVRDLLLEKQIADFDFATPLNPDEILKTLDENDTKAVPTGLKYGTITAVINKKNFEITTLRKDQNTDGRHCDVEFVDDYFLDASRRDFTINCLYLDAEGLIYDYFQGIKDLEDKKVRFINDAKKRIEEDFLRILRFFRFSCDFSSELDPQGLEGCLFYKSYLKNLSRERIRCEFFKLINSSKKKNLINILLLME
jgi:poly(A) polymerase